MVINQCPECKQWIGTNTYRELSGDQIKRLKEISKKYFRSDEKLTGPYDPAPLDIGEQGDLIDMIDRLRG